jgi:hypothetical protein
MPKFTRHGCGTRKIAKLALQQSDLGRSHATRPDCRPVPTAGSRCAARQPSRGSLEGHRSCLSRRASTAARRKAGRSLPEQNLGSCPSGGRNMLPMRLEDRVEDISPVKRPSTVEQNPGSRMFGSTLAAIFNASKYHCALKNALGRPELPMTRRAGAGRCGSRTDDLLQRPPKGALRLARPACTYPKRR